jgi:hypothetical protein
MGPFWLWKPLESFWFEVYSLMGRETRRGRRVLSQRLRIARDFQMNGIIAGQDSQKSLIFLVGSMNDP